MHKYDCIIHIGTPKSGSSAIQHYCVSNNAELAKHGYLYPPHSLDKNGISGGHTELYTYLQNNQLDAARECINKLVSQAKKQQASLLLSSEGLFAQHAALKQVCGDHKCAIVAVYRDPLEASLSAYSQMVKRNFFSKPLSEYLSNLYHNPKPVYAGLTLLDWAKSFGKHNMYVLPYTRGCGKDSIIYSMLELLGLHEKMQVPSTSKTVNSSYHPALLELKRRLNLVLDDSQQKISNQLDLIFQQLSDQAFLPAYSIMQQLSAEQRNAFTEKFSNAKQTVEREFNISSLAKQSAAPQPELSLRNYYQRLHADMLLVVEHLEAHHHDLYASLSTALKQAIGMQQINEDLNSLRMLFNIDTVFTDKVAQTWFSDRILENMTDYTEVDFLRETAKVLYHRGDIKMAAKLIEKAKSIRHNGPAIKSLEAKILAKLADSASSGNID